MTKTSFTSLAFLGASLVFGGCGIVLGLDDYKQGEASSGTGNSGQGGSAGQTSGSTGGAAGMGGMSGCMPGSTQPCYTGAAGTQGVASCKAGTQKCLADGSGFGVCEGEVLPGIESCSTPGDEDCNGSSCSETIWARIFGDTAAQQGVVVAPDGKGGVFYAGSMDGTVKFENDTLITGGGRDIFLTHIGPDGKCIWSKRFGDAADQDPTDLVVDAQGNVYLSASVDGIVDFGGGPLPNGGYTDIAIASFDAQGKYRWSHRYGDSSAQDPRGMTISPAGELIVAGSFGGTFNSGTTTLTSKGDWDVFVLKLDLATGNEIWAKQFGATKLEQTDAVAVDATGGIVVLGRYAGFVSMGGMVLPISMVSTDMNVFVLKLDSDGKHIWSNGYGDSEGFQFASGLAVDKDGAVLLAGEFEGTMNFGGANLTSPAGSRDIYLAKLTSTGMHAWSKKYGGPADDRWPRLAVDASANVFISCYFTYSIDFGGTSLLSDGSYDIAVARLNPDGSHVWSRRFGDTPADLKQQTSSDIAWSPGALFVAGSQMGAVDYGTGPLVSAGSFDAMVMAIGP